MQLIHQLVWSLTLLQGLLQVSALNYTSFGIEIDPDTATSTGNCSDAFYASLNIQVGVWFAEATASQKGVDAPVSNASALVRNTMRQGQRYGGGDRMLEGIGAMTVAADSATAVEQGERKLAWPCGGCYTCCQAGCTNYCSCNLCGRRNLRSESRELDGQRSKWWAGNYQQATGVAGDIQFAARRWLKRNDQAWCMGNPWKVAVLVNYY